MNITVAIPIFNGANTIKNVLDRLTMQKIPGLNVIAYDNGSNDGTRGLLGELFASHYYATKRSKDAVAINFAFFGGHHEPKHPYHNALRTRRLIAEIANTEHIFFLDSDVILPVDALTEVGQELSPANMYVGIQYEPDCGRSHNHVMFGATLWKRSDFLTLPDAYDPSKGCDCKYASDWAIAQGRPAKYHSRLMAYHSKSV